jgi:hypothetical protein
MRDTAPQRLGKRLARKLPAYGVGRLIKSFDEARVECRTRVERLHCP